MKFSTYLDKLYEILEEAYQYAFERTRSQSSLYIREISFTYKGIRYGLMEILNILEEFKETRKHKKEADLFQPLYMILDSYDPSSSQVIQEDGTESSIKTLNQIELTYLNVSQKENYRKSILLGI